MSYYAEEHYEVYEEKLRRANKPHTCSACEETIERGHRYWVVSWVFDGSADSIKRCLKCQTIHVHLRGIGAQEEMWPSETLSCGEEYEEHWGKPPPEEIARLAFVTQADMQKEFQVPS